MNRVFIGYDSREAEAYAVCLHSLRRHIAAAGPAASLHIRASGIGLDDVRGSGLYRRHTTRHGNGQLWDSISAAPMSTEFAISRFLTPILAGRAGWALFIDCDMLWRTDPRELFKLADPRYAVMCVQHNYQPANAIKMDGQAQLGENDSRAAGRYTRKLWSSAMLFNCGHPANDALTVDLINTVPGRDLHRFCWLNDDQIGALPQEWNFIPGHSPDEIAPKLIHWTEGGPWFEGYRDVPFAEEWRAERSLWLSE